MSWIQLTLGQVALIDKADEAIVFGRKWHAVARRDGKGFYAADNDGRKMHRVLMDAPTGVIVDHRNGDGLDNRRHNIRIGTQSKNCVNRKQTPGPHLKGARPKKGLWQAYIKLAGKQRSLGYYKTEAEAHSAYLLEATRIHGDWMPLPDPPSLGPPREP